MIFHASDGPGLAGMALTRPPHPNLAEAHRGEPGGNPIRTGPQPGPLQPGRTRPRRTRTPARPGQTQPGQGKHAARNPAGPGPGRGEPGPATAAEPGPDRTKPAELGPGRTRPASPARPRSNCGTSGQWRAGITSSWRLRRACICRAWGTPGCARRKTSSSAGCRSTRRSGGCGPALPPAGGRPGLRRPAR